MYLDSEDYKTIWQVAHNWTNHEPHNTDPKNLPTDLRAAIHRLMIACMNQRITLRNRRWLIFINDSILTFLFEVKHYIKFNKCVRQDIFDKPYLDSIYVKRAEVIAFCEKEYLTPPPMWNYQSQITNQKYDDAEDANEGWYHELTDLRRQRVACLALAKKLWLINPEQTYEQIYTDPIMKQFGNPSVFNFETFKKWCRHFAPEYATKGGRRSKTSS